MKNTLLSGLAVLLITGGCRKPFSGPGPSDLAGNWRKTAESANGQNLWCTYYYDSCALDDVWAFGTDGRYRRCDSGLRCAGTAAAGYWLLRGKELLLDTLAFRIRRWTGRSITIDRQEQRNGFPVRVEWRLER